MLRLPADLLERSPQEAVRWLALSFLKEASDARARFSDPQDLEALHDFRVAVRRLRSCCRAFRPYLRDSMSRKLRQRIRELTTATNAARDAEVLLTLVRSQSPNGSAAGHNGAEWLVKRLEARKAEAQQQLPSEVIAPFDALEPRLRKRLGRFETIVHLDGRRRRTGFGRVAGSLIRAETADLRAQLATIRGPDDVEVTHQARISAKRLRYVLEPLARRSKRAKTLVSSLKDLQDLLGDIHDNQVLQAEIGKAVEQAGAEDARRRHDAALEPAALAESAAPSPDVGSDMAGLARVGETRIDQLFGRLRSDWLEGRAEPLLQRVERFGLGLEKRRARHIEIERKFLLTGVPEVAKEVEPLEIDQGWIAGELVNERVRRTRGPESDTYSRTIKLGEGVARSEFEEPMTPDVFETMWELTVNRRISKRRYQVPDGNRTWEIDEFTDRELVLAEVEIDAEEEEVKVPDWLKPYVVREVTGEPEYVNVNLAK
jgi:CHAD domain-containing protein/CYTH domain-containing protein